MNHENHCWLKNEPYTLGPQSAPVGLSHSGQTISSALPPFRGMDRSIGRIQQHMIHLWAIATGRPNS